MPLETKDAITAAGVFVSGVLGVLNYKIAKEKKHLEDENRTLRTKLEDLQKKVTSHFSSTTWSKYLWQDIVLLGPRGSGKSALAKLWTQPWFDIHTLQQNAMWEVTEKDVCYLDAEPGKDSTFDVETNYRNILRLKIHDYPGADDQRARALKALPDLRNTVLLLLLQSAKNYWDENSRYYSKTFVDSFEEIPHLSTLVTKVVVVFSKIDELEGKKDSVSIRDELIQGNDTVISRLRTVFGDRMECIAVSSQTNENLIHLLGTACSPALPEVAKRKFREHIDRVNRVIKRL